MSSTTALKLNGGEPGDQPLESGGTPIDYIADLCDPRDGYPGAEVMPLLVLGFRTHRDVGCPTAIASRFAPLYLACSLSP